MQGNMNNANSYATVKGIPTLGATATLIIATVASIMGITSDGVTHEEIWRLALLIAMIIMEALILILSAVAMCLKYEAINTSSHKTHLYKIIVTITFLSAVLFICEGVVAFV